MFAVTHVMPLFSDVSFQGNRLTANEASLIEAKIAPYPNITVYFQGSVGLGRGYDSSH